MNLNPGNHRIIIFPFFSAQEFETNWEESRQGRVDSWMSFQKGAAGAGGKHKEKKAKKFSPIGFRPPKTKPESR